jgi:hypothetical protein
MGIMSALGGIAAHNPAVTALAGGGLIPTLLAMRKKGGGADPTGEMARRASTGQNYEAAPGTPGVTPGAVQNRTPGFFG